MSTLKERMVSHVLNGYDGNTVSIKYITNKTKEVIDEKYLK